MSAMMSRTRFFLLVAVGAAAGLWVASAGKAASSGPNGGRREGKTMTYEQAAAALPRVGKGMTTLEVAAILGEPAKKSASDWDYDFTRLKGFPGLSAFLHGATIAFDQSGKVDHVDRAWVCLAGAAPGPKLKRLLFDKDIQGRFLEGDVKAREFLPPRFQAFYENNARVEGRVLMLDGYLFNHDAKKRLSVVVFPVHGNNPFTVELADPDVRRKPKTGPPLPSQAPPSPMEIDVPPLSEIQFRATLDLDDYEIPPTAKKFRTLRWTFHYWNKPVDGKRPFALPG